MKVARVVPCLDVTAGRVVKGVNFVGLRDAGDPVELAARYDAEGADELVFLDITASSDQRETMVDVVARTAEEVFIPLTVGGGIRSVEDARKMLRARRGQGQRQHVRGRAARADLRRSAWSSARNASCAPSTPAGVRTGGWEVYVHGGRTPTGLDALAWAEEAERRGAGEILLTSMDRDGTKEGYDLELTQAVERQSPACRSSPAVGSARLQHLVDGVLEGGADAVLAASIFHFGEHDDPRGEGTHGGRRHHRPSLLSPSTNATARSATTLRWPFRKWSAVGTTSSVVRDHGVVSFVASSGGQNWSWPGTIRSFGR